MGTGELTCERDDVATQLTCVGCATPICPNCLVRTPVGLKCQICTGRASEGRRRSIPLVAAVAVVVVPVLAWLVLVGPRSGSDSDDRVAESARDLQVVNAANQTRIGEEARDGSFSFKVSGVECVGREVGVPPETRVTQGQFCLVYLTVRNVGDRPEPFSGGLQLLADSSARRYHPGVMQSGPPPPPLVLSSGVKEITNVRLNPGAELEGVLIFDMPQGSKPAEFEFHRAPRSMGVKVRLDTLAP